MLHQHNLVEKRDIMEVEADAFAVLRDLVKEVELELAVVGCSVVVPLFPATPLQSRQVRRGKIRAFPA